MPAQPASGLFLRIYLDQGRGAIPSTGGTCNATVRIVNGLPSRLQDGTSICGQTVVAPRTNRFETYGSRYLFCLSKGVQGFAAVPEAQKQEAVRKMLGRP